MRVAERDTHSQVVLMGRVDAALTAMPWRGRSLKVWPYIAAALDALRAENDVVVIEGAGSPAEINLSETDIVNMRVATHGDACCLLVTDIDRGGAFAHLYGTWALLPEDERARIHGFVLNKFRGDPALLAPAPQVLFERTGVPTVATLPMRRQHGLPEEDGVFDDRGSSSGAVTQNVVVIAYPRISNLDEFEPLKNIPGVRLSWARTPAELHGLSCGLQMLGETLIDPHGIDGSAAGLGLLPLQTVFARAKTVRRTRARFEPLGGHGTVESPWARLSGVTVGGYEIHHGQTARHPGGAAGDDSAADDSAAVDSARAALPDGLGWQNTRGNVLGVYLHGLFEDPAVLHALFGAQAPTLDSVFDGLADFIERHFEAGVLPALIAPPT